jgi:hypothetical protein
MGGLTTPTTTYTRPIPYSVTDGTNYTASWDGRSLTSMTDYLNEQNSFSLFDNPIVSGLKDAFGFGNSAFPIPNHTYESFGKLTPEKQASLINAFNIQQANKGPGLMDYVGFGLNAYNMFNQISAQNEYLDMMRDQLGMAKEQWGITKDEINRINKVRNNLNAGYQTGNYGASPTSKTDY